MRHLIAGNWKMNRGGADAAPLAAAIAAHAPPHADLVLCPPFTALTAVAAALAHTQVALGAQDCHAAPSGAHTGDIAAPMLAEAGCRYVILGHSERRAAHGETSAGVRAKAQAAHEAGLIPIVCVGETEAERDAGQALTIVAAQTAASLPPGFTGALAYEPIWAIGTGRTPSPEDVAAMHAALRAELLRHLGPRGATIRLLYGGSVSPANAGTLLALPEVNGALVGGASLSAEPFLAIAAAAPTA